MPDAERFLTVRLGPHHLTNLRPDQSTRALVLEFESDQWVLYFLEANNKIIGSLFPVSLEAGLSLVQREFGVRPEEWTEDSPN